MGRVLGLIHAGAGNDGRPSPCSGRLGRAARPRPRGRRQPLPDLFPVVSIPRRPGRDRPLGPREPRATSGRCSGGPRSTRGTTRARRRRSRTSTRSSPAIRISALPARPRLGLASTGPHARGEARLRAYVKARPDDPAGHIGAAKTAEALDDEDAALAHYQEVLRIDRDNVVGLQGLAAIRLRRRDPGGAISLLDRPSPGSRTIPRRITARAGRWIAWASREEAKKAFATQARLQKEQTRLERIRKGLVRDPNNVDLMAEAASWLLGHGYDEEGLVWAEKTLARRSGRADMLRLLADYYSKKGDPGRANFYRSQLPKG